MARDLFDRYAMLKMGDGTLEPMPFIRLSENASDKFEYWNEGFSRMDKLSKKYYGSPFYDFLIMMANPQFLNEFEIPDNSLIRIPFPLNRVKSEFQSKMEFHVQNLD